MTSHHPLTTLLALAMLLFTAGISQAETSCPLPATELDQESALQALQLHDQYAVNADLLPELEMLLSEDFSIEQTSDDDTPTTLMRMDRQAYLDNAGLAAAFSSDIKAEREQISARTTDTGLQLRFIETDTGTVMGLPMHIVSRNRADLALQDGCIILTAWQFTELSNVAPADEDADPLQQALDKEIAKMGIDMSVADAQQREMTETLIITAALKAHSISRVVQVQVDACDDSDLRQKFEEYKRVAADKIAIGELIYKQGLMGQDSSQLKSMLDESLTQVRAETAAASPEQMAQECQQVLDSLPALIEHFGD